MLLFGRGFFFVFRSLGTTRLCFRPTSLLTSKPMFLPRDTISSITAESSLSKPKSFVTRDTVRHPRRFVFGKFVRKPNCSRSEAFVNRGLTVYIYIYIYIYICVCVCVRVCIYNV